MNFLNFREFITNRLFRRKLQAEIDEFDNIRPPVNPSRRYIDKLVERLLSEKHAKAADRELELIGSAAVPSLLAALRDPRFLREKRSDIFKMEPLSLLLALLVPHAPADLVSAAKVLVSSTSAEIRKTAAIRIATTGRDDAVPLLADLLNDPDGFVRSYVRIGVQRALSAGACTEVFRERMYELLLNQCDQIWDVAVNDAAGAVVALDPTRAAVDFASERWLSLSNPYVHKILEQCNENGIPLPATLIRRLLDHSLPLAVGKECYPHQYIVGAALQALARSVGEQARPFLESALNSDQEEIQEAAGKGIAYLSGIDDPIRFVCDRIDDVAFEGLTVPQRNVYCALVFDNEVCNGGLMQFFGNSSGDHAADTLEALRVLGHPEACRALETAMKLVGPLSREPNREMRLAAFEDRFDELRAGFKPLENDYYRTKSRLRQRLMLYAANHSDSFRKPANGIK